MNQKNSRPTLKIKLSQLRSRLTIEQQLAGPAFLATLITELLLFIHAVTTPVNGLVNALYINYSLLAITYFLLVFFILLPRINTNPYIRWVIALINTVFMGVSSFMIIGLGVHFLLLIALCQIVLMAILFGRWPTLLFGNLFLFFESVVLLQSVTNFDTFLEFLVFPVLAIVITETILFYKNHMAVQIKRLDALHKLSQSMSSSLEAHQVVNLISSAIQSSFEADTYYVGFLEPDQKTIRLELLFDDGEFFDNVHYNVDESLGGWVVKNRKPLLLKDLPKEAPLLGINHVVVGQPKTSLSWMGTTLQAGGVVLGLVAAASYQKSAFTRKDLELLEDFAQQAALAISNANIFGEVERQSRLDSLTGVLNHGQFLKLLSKTLATAAEHGQRVSVIMIDIDFFKQYNDQYGHLMGDQVLTSLAKIIENSVRSTDPIGRWGGEEFCVALYKASLSDAHEIAGRIQRGLTHLDIKDRAGINLPSPTVSIGIAVFPEDGTDSITLIDSADKRLYNAKDKGRNQIIPTPQV